MSIRWLSRSRVSMQRLGFCKAVLIFNELSRSPEQMANVLREKLEEQLFTVECDEGFKKWLQGQGKNIEGNPKIVTGLQKLYVYNHPSQSGWLSRLGFKEYVEYLPQRLGLVSQLYEPTDMGLVLSQGLMSKEDHNSFLNPSDSNPLMLTSPEQLFFLYALLAADGDFLLPFCEALLNQFGNDVFNYLEAGSVLPNTIDAITYQFSTAAYTQSDRKQLENLDRARQQILKNIAERAEEQGSGSRREQTTIPRLEWLVDIGLAKKVESRTWKFTEAGLKLKGFVSSYTAEMTRKYPENVMAYILDSKFYKIAADTHNMLTSGLDIDGFLSYIQPAYKKFVGIGGYALLRPTLLYANITSLANSTGIVIEYEEAVKLLEDIYQTDSTLLHYTIDRFNTDYQFKIGNT